MKGLGWPSYRAGNPPEYLVLVPCTICCLPTVTCECTCFFLAAGLGLGASRGLGVPQLAGNQKPSGELEAETQQTEAKTFTTVHK